MPAHGFSVGSPASGLQQASAASRFERRADSKGAEMATHLIDGPYFEDFETGQTFGAPSVTVTEGHAVLYQALTGDRMRLPLDHELSHAVTGSERPLVHPMLVINLVNGQTTFASQHVKGNLFYRGLLLLKPVFIGDTLETVTKVVGLRQNRVKPDRAATGRSIQNADARLCRSAADVPPPPSHPARGYESVRCPRPRDRTCPPRKSIAAPASRALAHGAHRAGRQRAREFAQRSPPASPRPAGRQVVLPLPRSTIFRPSRRTQVMGRERGGLTFP